MSSDSKLQKLPLEIGLQIAGYLTAQELVNASASCKYFYTSFANQTVWEAAYRELLNGYPADHFVFTDAVKLAKRPNYINFNSAQEPEVEWLDDWRTSWKQRTVFVLHVLNVQRQLVTIAQQQTQAFKPVPAAPLYDSNYISRMEEYVGAIFPIDFVLFLQSFAHYLTVDFDPEFPKAALASGPIFENEQNWRQAIHTSQFTEFNAGGTEQQQLARTQNLSDATLEYLNRMKSICFSMPRTMQDGEGKDYLSLLLDIDSSLQDQVPPIAANELIYVDFQSMANGIGKVADNHIFRDLSYQYRCIAESFTDYLIQYTAVIIKLGTLPSGGSNHYSNLVSPLQRFPGLPKSILLPQHEGWNVANYTPVHINDHREPILPVRGSSLLSSAGPRANVQWDPQLPDPPFNMMGGFSKAWWAPYSVPEALRNGRVPSSFLQFKDKEMPKPRSRQITVDIYRTQQQMINDWFESATSSVQTTEVRDAEAVEQVRQRTSQMTDLFEKFQTRLPAMLYYQAPGHSHSYLYCYKNFMDHLQALESNNYKYSVDELQAVEEQLRKHLNLMHLYSLKPTRGRLGYGIDLDGISELAIDWSRV